MCDVGGVSCILHVVAARVAKDSAACRDFIHNGHSQQQQQQQAIKATEAASYGSDVFGNDNDDNDDDNDDEEEDDDSNDMQILANDMLAGA